MLDSPAHLRARPAPQYRMNTDVLSDVLGAVHLTGAVYFDFSLGAPWVVEAPPSSVIAPLVMPGAQRVIEYHLIAQGSCWGHAVGQEPIALREGDLLLFPQGDPHVLSSTPGLRATPDLSMFGRSSAPLPYVYEVGRGSDTRTRIVCAFMGCDERPYNPLLSALPATIHLSSSRSEETAGWLGMIVNVAAHESGQGRPGGENVLSRLSELMFVEAIRRYLESLPADRTGWLAGLRDPMVGQALAAIHAEPRAAWTVESLARCVGSSRSVLAERFAELVGHPPMHYLAMWRMQLASRLLLEGRNVAAVAEAVGYESEAAFSRAFRKLVGQSPGTWRQQRSPDTTRPGGVEPAR